MLIQLTVRNMKQIIDKFDKQKSKWELFYYYYC